jgi:hypothetical protein
MPAKSALGELEEDLEWALDASLELFAGRHRWSSRFRAGLRICSAWPVEDITWKCEQAVRIYPSISCATHFLKVETGSDVSSHADHRL